MWPSCARSHITCIGELIYEMFPIYRAADWCLSFLVKAGAKNFFLCLISALVFVVTSTGALLFKSPTACYCYNLLFFCFVFAF